MASVSGKPVDKTPASSRHPPLRDITNSSSIRSTRQSSLLDHFPASSDIAPSSPASLDDLPSNHGASTSSPCVNTRTFAREVSVATRSLSFPALEAEDSGFSERADYGEEERIALKRRRSVSGEIGEATLVRTLDATAKRKLASQQLVPGRQLSAYALLNRRTLGLRVSAAQVSMRPLLRDMVSSNESDVYRLLSAQPHRSFAIPFACAFSRAAKAGGKQVLAVASEEGIVSFINAGESAQRDAEHGRTSFRAHQNAIFDLAWNKDDSCLATASGDQTVKLFDSETQVCVGVLDGHTSTIKNVTWAENPNMLATASRDGSIRIWDRRTASNETTNRAGDANIATVNLIKNAHAVKGKNTKHRSGVTSVTSVVYLHQSEHLLASAGSSDSIVKVWDLRKAHSRRVNPAFVENNEEAVAEKMSSSRPHGISSMVLSPNGQKLYALSTDRNIYAFDPNNLSYPAPLQTFRHPLVCYGSFYVRMSISPCSRYIATGSSDGGVYMWDSEGGGSDGVRLLGHEKEVGCVDWGKDILASTCDDDLVRVWRVNSKKAQESRKDKCTRWRWSGETEDDEHSG